MSQLTQTPTMDHQGENQDSAPPPALVYLKYVIIVVFYVCAVVKVWWSLKTLRAFCTAFFPIE